MLQVLLHIPELDRYLRNNPPKCMWGPLRPQETTLFFLSFKLVCDSHTSYILHPSQYVLFQHKPTKRPFSFYKVYKKKAIPVTGRGGL
jgi:hypothetical protein